MCTKLISWIFRPNTLQELKVNTGYKYILCFCLCGCDPGMTTLPAGPSQDKYLHFIDQVSLPRPAELTVRNKNADWDSHILNPLHLSHEVPHHHHHPQPNSLASYKYSFIIQCCILPLPLRPLLCLTYTMEGQDCSDVLLARSSDVS